MQIDVNNFFVAQVIPEIYALLTVIKITFVNENPSLISEYMINQVLLKMC